MIVVFRIGVGKIMLINNSFSNSVSIKLLNQQIIYIHISIIKTTLIDRRKDFAVVSIDNVT